MTLVVMLALVIMTAAVLHAYIGTRDSEQARNTGAVMTAWVIGAQLRADGASSPDAMQRSCNRLIDQTGVLAVCVWDQSGKITAGAAVADELLRSMQCRPPARDRQYTVELVSLPANVVPGRSAARRVETETGIPLGPGQPARLGLLLDAGEQTGLFSHSNASFNGMLLGVGATVLLLGFWWLRREVVRPIMSLLAAAAASRSGGVEGDLVAREDELGTIARSLVGLREDLVEWRQRVEQIERRVDSEIAAETQRISRELRRIQREAWQDPLTGISNRRMLDEKFPKIFAAQRNARHDMSVVMIDLDHFKAANDALGHAVGDAVLQFVGELLRECLRADDFAVRYGGDEFLLILPGVSADNAMRLINRIIAMFVQRAKMIARIEPAPTMSAGVASIRQNRPATPGDLIEAADEALYAAKNRGGKSACLALAA
ncbi:MAG TPA: diguanylate cyclase [Phycisphaerae bacterium]|nr:diguanylate cyclase [Phycisphaerae bacterium]